MMEIRSGMHFERDARPPRSEWSLPPSLRPLLVLFIVLFDWHFSYKQKRRGGEQKKKSPRRAVPPSASVCSAWALMAAAETASAKTNRLDRTLASE